MYNKENTSTSKKIQRAFFFAFHGPLFGHLCVTIGLILFGFYKSISSDLQGMLGLLYFLIVAIGLGFIFTYIIGAIPAFLTGFISSLGNSKTEEMVLAIVSGAVTSYTGAVIINSSEMIFAMAIGLVGAISGFACVSLRYQKLAATLQPRTDD